MTKWKREVTAAIESVGAEIATVEQRHGGHLCFELNTENGSRKLFTSVTPSDKRRSLMNLRSTVRRVMR